MDGDERSLALFVIIFLQKWLERRIMEGRMLISWISGRRRARQACTRRTISAGFMARGAYIPETANSFAGHLGHVQKTEERPRRRLVRRLWVKPRTQLWWDSIKDRDDDNAWRENFRMSRGSFEFIVEHVSPYMRRRDTNYRKAIDMRKRVGIALWRLATGSDFRTIQELFGIARSTACIILQEFIVAVCVTLNEQFLHHPTEQEVQNIVQRFRDTWEFPQCVGAIDGTHIPIIAPEEDRNDYYNRKGWYSIICQAVVDSRYVFWDVDVGWPGKVHDVRVLANSTVFQLGEAERLFPRTTESFGGVDVPLYIIGDPAYPLKRWLMKPFPEGRDTTDAQRNYNYRLSRARMTVECAFGRLKGRWRALMKRNDHHVTLVPQLVQCCAILHNICERRGELYNDDPNARPDVQQPRRPQNAQVNRGEQLQEANIIRDAVCRHLSGEHE